METMTVSLGSSRDLAGATAFVTGGSRGIGAAVAYRLSGIGLAVGVGFRQDARAATDVVRCIESSGGRAIPVRCDVASECEVAEAFDLIEGELGPVGVLVNNAGVHRSGRITALGVDDWRCVIDASLTGAFLCVRRAVPKMRADGFGRIINVSSVIGLNGFPGDVAYASATRVGQTGGGYAARVSELETT